MASHELHIPVACRRKMKCPRCVQLIHRAAETCPHCGFSLDAAVTTFGSHKPRLTSVSDAAGLLNSRSREQLKKALERLQGKFPQVIFTIYTDASLARGNLRELGFWLLNQAEFPNAEGRSSAAGLLIILDAEARAATITTGYLLEPYFGETESFECLARGHPCWLEGRFAEGLHKVLQHLAVVLTKRCKQGARRPQRFSQQISIEDSRTVTSRKSKI